MMDKDANLLLLLLSSPVLCYSNLEQLKIYVLLLKLQVLVHKTLHIKWMVYQAAGD